MKAISLVGFKNSGKTTLAINLVKEFTARGLNVAAAKFSGCGFSEPENSDTALLKKAGATAVLGFAETESTISWQTNRPLLELMPLVDADVLVVEGGKSLGYLPRVILTDGDVDLDGLSGNALDPRLALCTCGDATIPGVTGLCGTIGIADLVMEKGFLLPGLSCGGCGRKGCREMARDIVAGRGTIEECTAMGGDFTVKVNGNELGLNPFVGRMLASGLAGMLSELKGYAPGKVDISFKS